MCVNKRPCRPTLHSTSFDLDIISQEDLLEFSKNHEKQIPDRMDRAENSLLPSRNDSEAPRYSVLLEKRYGQEFRRASGRF